VASFRERASLPELNVSFRIRLYVE
jgi:hypothetical protein